VPKNILNNEQKTAILYHKIAARGKYLEASFKLLSVLFRGTFSGDEC
jgi:hypothetical protein